MYKNTIFWVCFCDTSGIMLMHFVQSCFGIQSSVYDIMWLPRVWLWDSVTFCFVIGHIIAHNIHTLGVCLIRRPFSAVGGVVSVLFYKAGVGPVTLPRVRV